MSVVCRASDLPADRQTLKGLPTFSVSLEISTEDLRPLGITKDQLQTAVELRLRAVGIKIAPSDAAGPFLYIVINELDISPSLVAFNIDTSLFQPVSLPRLSGNSKLFLAATWSAQAIGSAGTMNAKQGIVQCLNDLADKFANAYLSVNPK